MAPRTVSCRCRCGTRWWRCWTTGTSVPAGPRGSSSSVRRRDRGWWPTWATGWPDTSAPRARDLRRRRPRCSRARTMSTRPSGCAPSPAGTASPTRLPSPDDRSCCSMTAPTPAGPWPSAPGSCGRRGQRGVPARSRCDDLGSQPAARSAARGPRLWSCRRPSRTRSTTSPPRTPSPRPLARRLAARVVAAPDGPTTPRSRRSPAPRSPSCRCRPRVMSRPPYAGPAGPAELGSRPAGAEGCDLPAAARPRPQPAERAARPDPGRVWQGPGARVRGGRGRGPGRSALRAPGPRLPAAALARRPVPAADPEPGAAPPARASSASCRRGTTR